MYHRKSGFGYVALHVECVRAMITDVPTDESVMGQFNEILQDRPNGCNER